MQFLYPSSRQYPFDEVCERIVRALHARNWKVPGFSVTFHDYGRGAQKLRCVDEIVSDQSAIDLGHHDVRIRFGRPQGILPGGRFNDVGAVSEVRIGSRALRVYEDESGPTYEVYVGHDWERDRHTFWSCYNARLHHLPRLCLRYSGAGFHRTRAEILRFVDDSREYAPQGDEPREYRTEEIMESVRSHLLEVILPAIDAHPPAPLLEDLWTEPPALPVPSSLGPLVTRCERRDERRIEQGKKSLDELVDADRYALYGGRRLAPTYIERGPDLPEVAYDGFIWCGPMGAAGWRVPGYVAGYHEDVLVKVTPRDARGIYVADNAAYDKLQEATGKAIKDGRRHFTDAEVNAFVRARACTIVPISDYQGGFEDPVYLINRELAFDEVELIGTRPS